MSDMAYICFHVKAQINRSTNGFSLDGGRRIPLSEGRTYYRVPAGEHEVTVFAGNGGEWTISRELEKRELLTVKAEAWEENISDVLYKMDQASPITYLRAKSIPKTRVR